MARKSLFRVGDQRQKLTTGLVVQILETNKKNERALQVIEKYGQKTLRNSRQSKDVAVVKSRRSKGED